MNRGQLVQRISQIQGLATTGADSTEELAMIQDVINEAIIDILSRTRLYVRCTNITLAAGVKDYELAGGILRLYDIYRGTTLLQEVAPGDVDRSGSSSYTQVGFNLIRIGWSPDVNDGYGLTISAWYTPRPTPLSADVHDPSVAPYGSIPAEFHKAIVNYACWRLADMAGDQGSARGDKYKAWYEGPDGTAGPGTDLGQIKAATNTRGSSGSRRMRLRRSGESLTGDAYPDRWIG